jgi:transcriptional regulator with XRE-family HTH domain
VSQPTSAQLGAAIRQVRKSRGLSIEDLAAEAGLHWTSVSRIENGRQSPTWDSIADLATALKIDIADLARVAAEQPASLA